MTSAPAWTAGARQEQTLTLLELYRDRYGERVVFEAEVLIYSDVMMRATGGRC